MRRGLIFLIISLLFIETALAANIQGTFSIDKARVQIGDKFLVSGVITSDGTPLQQGYVIVDFKNQDKLFTTSAPVVNGAFSVESFLGKAPDGSYMPQGNYDIGVTVNDGYGNEKIFYVSTPLYLSTSLKLDLSLDKTDILPGDTIKLSGIVLREIDDKKIDGKASIYFDTNEFLTTINNGLFSYTAKIPSDIKSGPHNITLLLDDGIGNTLNKIIMINIIPIPTKIDNLITQMSYKPLEVITFTPNLYDQANDLINEKAIVKIQDPNGKVVYSDEVNTNEPVEFTLEQYSEPGAWKILTESADLKTQTALTVEEVKKLESELIGQSILFKNTGNVDYNDDILIQLTGEREYNLVKRSRLSPGESVIVDLYKDVKSGTYSLVVQNTQLEVKDLAITDSRSIGSKTSDFFKTITGAVVMQKGSTTSLKPLLYLFILVAVLFSAALLIHMRAKKIGSIVADRERKKGKSLMERLRKEKESKAPAPKYGKFGKAEDSDISDFKQRILNDIKDNPVKRESQPKKFEFDKPLERKGFQRDKKDSGKDDDGLFNMFD